MKKTYRYICTALAICLLSACVESHRDFDDYEPSLTAAPFIIPSQTRLTFTATESQQTVTITSNCTWTVSASQNWIHVTANAIGNKVVVKADENTKLSQRQATITFTGEEGNTATIDVEQKALGSVIFSVNNNGRTVSFKMILVEAGNFQMGSNSGDSDEQPVHRVYLTNHYYLGETEVTQALWYAVMGLSPTSDTESWNASYGLGDNYPAYGISYEDCQQFLTKLNQLTGQQFRFPTEAEWEFAARGGTKSKGYTYAGSNTIDEVAWYGDNSDWKSYEVKTMKGNELGLYDMNGNVWEWCEDWYGSYSSTAVIVTDPTGPATGSDRVVRGGSYDSYCTVSFRLYGSPSIRYESSGFRLAL